MMDRTVHYMLIGTRLHKDHESEEKGMGFRDKDVENSFDGLFDFNRDGVLDPLEQEAQYEFFSNGLEENGSSYEEDDEPDLDDLEFMDEDERREALEDAGYDPDDF